MLCRKATASAAIGLACACAWSDAGAAHEWRADWAAPQSLEILERAVHPAAEAAIVELRTCVPYGVAGLSFHGTRIAHPVQGWQIHAGTLRSEDYREWHLGAGQTLRAGPDLRVLVGLRALGIDGPRPAPVRLTGTLLLSASPRWLRALEITGGLVDGGPGAGDVVPSIAVTRVGLSTPRVRVLLDRSSVRGADSETSLLVWFGLGSLGFMQGYRWGVGEVSAAITLRSGRCHITIGERWHPALGGTPRVAIAWTGEGAAAW
jgi:hypothetical protein